MSKIPVCLLFLFISISLSTAQEKSSHFTFSSAVTLTGLSEGVHKYSAPGWGVGVGFANDLTNYAQFLAEASYQYFEVDIERVYARHSGVKTLGWTIRGQASQVFEGKVGLRINFTTGTVRPFTIIGGGAMLLKSGEILSKEMMPLFIRGDEIEVLGFVFLGFGLEFPIADFLSSSISAEISTPFVVKGVAIPITSRWYFHL